MQVRMMEYLFFLSLIFAAFIVVSVVNYSEKNPKLRELTFIFIGLSASMFLVFGILILIASVTKIINFPHLGSGLIISSIVCFLLLMRNVRRRVIELLRLDMNPDSAIHAFGMVLFFTSVIISISIFFVMASTTPEDLKKTGLDMQNINLTLFDVVANETVYLILALIGCGFLARRNLKEILIRLGVVKPKFKEVIIGLTAGLMLIFAAGIIALLFTQLFGLPEAENLDIMLRNLMTLEGAFVVGLSSGICEEILFRGALQPKFGILLTSILFTLLHFQYSSTMVLSLSVIFVLSISLGYLKNRTNTTTAMIAHASFNTVQILIALLVIGSS